jgi:hypothetical protein
VIEARFFNTAGPCDPEWHYMLPAIDRVPGARSLIERRQYFVLHAPRQTGKTTVLKQLAQQLTAAGRYYALYFSCEVGEPFSGDIAASETLLLDKIGQAAEEAGWPVEARPPDTWFTGVAGNRLNRGLAAWCASCPRPLVLFVDEIDTLIGEPLRAVLRQVREGYIRNRRGFPHSMVLCGVRDVRDYKMAAGGSRLGTASPFNVKSDSLRMGDFTEVEVAALYRQHTAEVGQEFTDEAVARAFGYTQGQPWLVNAIADEIIFEFKMGVAGTITADHVDQAKERLIRDRATHLDSLAATLMDPRVRPVIGTLLSGDPLPGDTTYNDDIAYLRDLGLLANSREVRIANPIYQEVVARVLAEFAESQIETEPSSFRLADGRLDFERLLDEFAAFWVQHGEILTSGDVYHESAPQLVMMGFLHRIVNGGGYVDREYGVGRGRIDLLIRQPYVSDGSRRVQREALELKVWRNRRPDPLSQGLLQLDAYLDRLDLDHGTLVVFDRRHNAAAIVERTVFDSAKTPSGRPVRLLRA